MRFMPIFLQIQGSLIGHRDLVYMGIFLHGKILNKCANLSFWYISLYFWEYVYSLVLGLHMRNMFLASSSIQPARIYHSLYFWEYVYSLALGPHMRNMFLASFINSARENLSFSLLLRVFQHLLKNVSSYFHQHCK